MPRDVWIFNALVVVLFVVILIGFSYAERLPGIREWAEGREEKRLDEWRLQRILDEKPKR